MSCLDNGIQAEDKSEDQKTLDVGEETQKEIDTGYRILTEIIRQNKSACYPFMDEVDVKALGLWDYHIKVKTPMWINRLLEKFNQNEYTSITDFAKDFRQIVENCYRYNSTDHAISKKAKRLEMAFESKLALLKKDMRDKTLLSVTSGGRFSLEMTSDDNNLVPVSRYGRIGNTREYASSLDDDSAKLVFDFVRCEETMLHEDEKKASYRERRQQEFLYQRIAAAWIATIEENSDIKAIKSSAALPEVAFFVHICESVLKLPELNMYQFERSLLVPQHSIFLSKIMTSLLCSYQERSQISHRPPMLFTTWNKRLKDRFTKWFELVQKHNSYSIAADKIGVDIQFFKTLNWENPFVSASLESFSDLQFEQKVHTLKALCDALFSLQSVQNALVAMDAMQLKCMQLGKDYLGNCYIYFPQFCGDEVRVYRHREHGDTVPVVEPDKVWTPPKPPPSPEAQNNSIKVNGSEISGCKTDQNGQMGMDLEMKMDCDNMEDKIETENINKPLITTDHAAANQDSSNQDLKNTEIVVKQVDLQTSHCDKPDIDTSKNVNACEPNSNSHPDSSENTDTPTQTNGDVLDIPPELLAERRPRRARKQTTRYTDLTVTASRKSTRNRHNHVTEKENKSAHPDPSNKRVSRKRDSKKPEKEPVIKYGSVDFEMLCNSVDSIQLLINELEAKNTKENKGSYGREASENHTKLIEKLRWLYDELEPWNIKLQKARLSAQICMKKEHDELQNMSLKGDIWMEELSSKNSVLFGDNLTISHNNSPMSSVASFDGDDDEYVHPYFTRKSQADSEVPPVEKQYDELLYEHERQTLVRAALMELDDVLKSNMKGLLDLADRTELQESNPSNDRRTRNKVKQQNKLLGRILQFAEDNCLVWPSLLPILVPNSDVFDTVDMVYLEEETRLQEVADELRRKRLEKKKRAMPKSFQEKGVIIEPEAKKRDKPSGSHFATKNTFRKIPHRNAFAIKLQDGRVVPATRLSDGTVIPIQRANDASPAATVEQLIENTHKEVERRVGTVPTISLKTSQKAHTQFGCVSSNNQVVDANASSAVTVVVPHAVNQNNTHTSKIQSIVTTPQVSAISASQVNSAQSMQSIILNGTRYNLITQNKSVNCHLGSGSAVSVPPVLVSQPSVVRPILTPVQIINPTIKYQPTVKHNKPSNVVLVPVQNCATAGIGPIRVGATPVMGILASPPRQLQFQAADKK